MIRKLSQIPGQLLESNTLPWIIIGIGIFLRLYRYLYNPSLWFDESDIAIDFISRPFSEIVNPSPDYTQAYPYAFLITLKLFTQLLGNSEYVLRLFSLITGIISLFLFHKVARQFAEHNTVLIALGLFAILNPLIFQASNLKPYSSDVFFTLLIFTLAISIYSGEFNFHRIILFGFTGAVAVWFSNPSVVVLGGVGISLAVLCIHDKEWSKVRKLSMTYSIWLISFITNYVFYYQKLKASFGMNMKDMLLREDAYMPIPPASLADIRWFIELFFDIFNNPVEITFTGIAALAFITGCISMYLYKRRVLLILISPLMLALLAGVLHQYPFRGRFVFFLLPVIVIFIAEGAEYIRRNTAQSSRIIGLLFMLLLYFQPLSHSAQRVLQPLSYEDIKPVLNYIKENWQKGDMLYVHYYAQYPFEYYSVYYPEPYRFEKDEFIIGIAPRKWYRHWRKQEVSKYYDPSMSVKQTPIDIFKTYEKDLDQLNGHKRVWVLFTSKVPKDGIVEEKFLVYHLEKLGQRMDFFGRSEFSAVYLYNLGNNRE